MLEHGFSGRRDQVVAALDDALFSDALADDLDARAALYEALAAVGRGADKVRAAGVWYMVDE